MISQAGRRGQSILVYGLLMAAFGVFLPWEKGVDFLDPSLLSAYACIGMVFAGPAAARAFEQRPDSLSRAILWIGAAVALGEAVAIVMLACAFATLAATHRGPVFFGVDFGGLLFAALLGLAASLAAAALAAWGALQFSAGAARGMLRLALLGLLALFFLRGRWLPAVILPAIAIALAAAALFLLLLAARLRRA